MTINAARAARGAMIAKDYNPADINLARILTDLCAFADTLGPAAWANNVHIARTRVDEAKPVVAVAGDFANLTPQDMLRHHVSGAVERGEAEAIVEQPSEDLIIERYLADNECEDLDAWMRDSGYLFCTGCDESPTGCGWVDHNDNQVDPRAMLLDAIDAIDAAAQADAAEAGPPTVELDAPPPACYGWIVTTDYLAKPGERGNIGTDGPSNIDPAVKARLAELAATPSVDNVPLPDGVIHWRCRDDDGELYYEGLLIIDEAKAADDECPEMGPLDDFAMPDAGCTWIEHKDQDTLTWKQV